MTDLAPIRTLDGTELPTPGRWVIDAAHTSLAFEARHAVVTRMRGRFRTLAGSFTIADRPEDSSVEVTIDAASIDTNHPIADEHLRGEHYLDVAAHPHLTFRSTSVDHVGGDRWRVTGDLTIVGSHGRSSSTPRSTAWSPCPTAAKAKLGFTATGSFDRRDYGMEFNIPLPTGGVVVGNEVHLTLDVEADLPDDEAAAA